MTAPKCCFQENLVVRERHHQKVDFTFPAAAVIALTTTTVRIDRRRRRLRHPLLLSPLHVSDRAVTNADSDSSLLLAIIS